MYLRDLQRYSRDGRLIKFPIDADLRARINANTIPHQDVCPACYYGAQKPQPTPRWIRNRHQVAAWYDAWTGKSEYYQELWEYEANMWSKYGPQGGVVPTPLLDPLFERYYSVPRVHIPWELVMSRQVWVDRISRKAETVGKAAGYAEVKTVSTAAKLPFGGRKNSPINRSLFNTAPGQYGPLEPAVGGYRYQRQSIRTIFQDAAGNVARVQEILNRARNWLKIHFEQFSSWRRDSEVTVPWIRSKLRSRAWFMEGDFDKMDTHFSRKLAKFVLPLLEPILPEDDYRVLSDYVSAAFNQPLIWHDQIWTGEHCLFSGEPITNDFETLFTIVLETAIALAVESNSEDLKALGDDSIMAVLTEKQALEAADLFAKWSIQCGEVVNTQKLRISQVPRYLRRTHFARGGDEAEDNPGAYPVPLYFNSVFYPEYPCAKASDGIVAVLQASDNLYGHPLWSTVVTYTCANALDLSCIDGPAELDDRDWWYRLYGEKWDPKSSRTFKLLKKQKIVTAQQAQELFANF